jgi:hypothetical protein
MTRRFLTMPALITISAGASQDIGARRRGGTANNVVPG